MVEGQKILIASIQSKRRVSRKEVGDRQEQDTVFLQNSPINQAEMGVFFSISNQLYNIKVKYLSQSHQIRAKSEVCCTGSISLMVPTNTQIKVWFQVQIIELIIIFKENQNVCYPYFCLSYDAIQKLCNFCFPLKEYGLKNNFWCFNRYQDQ